MNERLAIPTEASLQQLRNRTALAGLVAFAVPFSLFLILAHFASERYIVSQFQFRLEASAATNAALLDDVIQTRANEIEGLGRQLLDAGVPHPLSASGGSPVRLRERLEEFTAGSIWYRGALVASAGGEIRAASRELCDTGSSASVCTTSIVSWPAFREARAGRTVIRAASGAPLPPGLHVVIATPLGANADTVLLGILDAEKLRTRLLDFGVGASEDALLVDVEGTLVAPSLRGLAAGTSLRAGGGTPLRPADARSKILSGSVRLQSAPFYCVVQVDRVATLAPTRELRQTILFYVAPFLLLGVILTFIAWRYAMRRIELLAQDLTQAVLVARQREAERDGAVQQLARRLEEERELARQKSLFQLQLAEYEKYAALGQLALGAAHEINNPLLGILSHLELERKYAKDPDVREETEQCIEGAKRIALTLRGLLNYARPGPPQLVLVNFERLVNDTLAFLHHHPLFRQIQLETALAPDLPLITADSNQLAQILMNLLLNSAEAMPDGGRITIGARPGPNRNDVDIWVEDNGSGIDPDVLPQVFQPFFTTKKGKGTGLGLSITQAYVRNHGGEIQVDSEPGRGTRVDLVLPVRPAGQPAKVPVEVIG